MLLFTKSKNKLLTILISILLVIQPLSGCIADFSFDSLNSKNKNLSKEQQESLQKALTVSSLIDAKTVNLQTNTGVIIKGSQIQATTVNFMANFLNLISDKNSESYSSFSDSSGVLTRTIINQGYVKETAVAAQVNAQKITLNGKTLLEDKLKPENLLKQLSSEYNLNEAQISQVKAELTNKEWYDKTTTLSQMGMIIVQAVVTVLTAGAGTALVTGINATVDAMVNAAINSMITQTLTQLATAAITGNKLDLDINTLLTNSLKAAALAGLTAQIDTNLGLNKEKLSFADKATKQILHGFAQKAVYGGNLESILATSAGNVAFDYIGHSVYSNDSQFPQLRDAIPKTVIHSLVGGTLSELAGGDFSQGAINTAVSHSVAEYIKSDILNNFDPKNPPFDKNNPDSVKAYTDKIEAQTKAIASVVSGAAVLATHEKVSDKDLKIAQDMGNSVVENNAFMLIVPTMLALATYANAPDIGEKTQDGLPASILNPAIDTAVFLYDATKELLDGGVPTEAIIVALAHKYKVDEATAKNVFENSKNVWNLPATTRGNVIEDTLAKTEYKDWFNVGKENNGYFPLIDFFDKKTNTAVSLKTVDTKGTTWQDRIEKHIEDLGSRGVNYDNQTSNMKLDIRVQKGGLKDAEYLIKYGKDNNVKVEIKEF